MRRVALLVLILIPTLPTLAGSSQARRTEAQQTAWVAYTSSLPLALTAQDICPGVEANQAMLVMMRIRAHVTEDGEAALEDKIREVAAGVVQAVRQAGKAKWCATVLGLYGTQGSVLPGLLKTD